MWLNSTVSKRKENVIGVKCGLVLQLAMYPDKGLCLYLNVNSSLCCPLDRIPVHISAKIGSTYEQQLLTLPCDPLKRSCDPMIVDLNGHMTHF